MSRDRLIKEYRKHPCLWSNKDGDAKNAEKRKESLSTITLELNKHEEKQQFTEEEVRTQFKNLRDMYRRKRKRLQLQQEINPASAVDEPGWIYFARLKFLDDGVDFGLPNGSPPPAPPPKKKGKSGSSARTSDDASLPTPLEEISSSSSATVVCPPPPAVMPPPSQNATSIVVEQQKLTTTAAAVKKEECCSPEFVFDVPETAAASLLLLGQQQTICEKKSEHGKQLSPSPPSATDNRGTHSRSETPVAMALTVEAMPMVEEKAAEEIAASNDIRAVVDDLNVFQQHTSLVPITIAAKQSPQPVPISTPSQLLVAAATSSHHNVEQMVEICAQNNNSVVYPHQQQQQQPHCQHHHPILLSTTTATREKRRRATDQEEDGVGGGGTNAEDEFTCFGRFVAMTMKKIASRSPIGALEARKQINDVLYRAELDSLSR